MKPYHYYTYIFLLTLPSCMAKYGTFSEIDQEKAEVIVEDVVSVVVVPFPPAHTLLSIETLHSDIMDTLLKQKLRETGYALFETTPSSPEAIPFHYTLDTISIEEETTSPYRITITIGNMLLSRLYADTDMSFQAINQWSQIEWPDHEK